MTISMTPSDDRIRIAILGSGIAGMSLALGIQNDPAVTSLCDVWIFEAYSQARDEEGHGVVNGYAVIYSAGLVGTETVMGERPDDAKVDTGITNLANPDDASPPGLVRKAMEAAGLTRHDHALGLGLGSGPGQGTIWEPKPLSYPSYLATLGVRRGRFGGKMRDTWEAVNESNPGIKHAPNRTVRWGKALSHITTQAASEGSLRPRQTLHFTDGSTFEADVVVGCDGVNSKVRPVVLGAYGADPSAAPTNGVMLRKMIPRKEAERIFGDYCRPRCQRSWVCDGVLILTDWVDHGESFQVIADWAHSGRPEGEKRSVIPWDKDRARRDFEKFGVIGNCCVQVFAPESGLSPGAQPYQLLAWSRKIHKTDPPSVTHPTEPICLTGDAAQAFQPYAGAGAGMAIKDSLVLSSLMRLLCRQHKAKVDTKSLALIESIHLAFKAYSTTRLPERLGTAKFADEKSWEWNGQGDNRLDPVKWEEFVGWVDSMYAGFSGPGTRSEVWDMIEQGKEELRKLTGTSP